MLLNTDTTGQIYVQKSIKFHSCPGNVNSNIPFTPLRADDPFSDSKMIGDPLKTLFVGRLSPITTENDLKQVERG